MLRQSIRPASDSGAQAHGPKGAPSREGASPTLAPRGPLAAAACSNTPSRKSAARPRGRRPRTRRARTWRTQWPKARKVVRCQWELARPSAINSRLMLGLFECPSCS